MIARLRGKVVGQGDGYAILEAGSIGYQVFMPRPVLEQVAERGDEVVLHTHLVVRDDGSPFMDSSRPPSSRCSGC